MALKFKRDHHSMLAAAGSVMAIWPTGDYSAYLPEKDAESRIGEYWKKAGHYLDQAIAEQGREEPGSNGGVRSGRPEQERYAEPRHNT